MERAGNSWLVEQSNTLIMWAWFVAPQHKYNSNIKNYWSQITIINTLVMKKFEISWKLPKCDRHMECATTVGKNDTDRLA